MASSELLFLFEFAVEELKTFSNAKNHRISARFGDLFKLKLKDPNEILAESLLPRRGGKKGKRNNLKMRHGRLVPQTMPIPANQTAIVVSDVQSLIQKMLIFPIEITHHSQDEPFVLGVAEIPWTSHHIDYLQKLETNPNQSPVVLRETYKSYDEYTSKRVALIKLKIQLSQLKDNFALTTQVRTKPCNQKPAIPTEDFTKTTVLETGTIRTIYSGGKQIDQSRKKNNRNSKHLNKQNCDVTDENKDTDKNNDIDKANVKSIFERVESVKNGTENIHKNGVDIMCQEKPHDCKIYADNSCEDKAYSSCKVDMDNNFGDKGIKGRKDVNSNSVNKDIESIVSRQKCFSRSSIATLVRSQTHIENKIHIKKHWSSTSIETKERFDTLKYIFGDHDRAIRNQVYCVGYFTVENDRSMGADSPGKKSPAASSTNLSATSKAKSEKSPPIKSNTDSDEPDQYTFNICGDKCEFGGPKNPCFEHVCNMDLPEEQRNAISITKCDNLICDYKKRAALLTEPTEAELPIFIDYSKSLKEKDCCVQKIEEVVGEMSAKLTNDPCLCTCECTFGFVKKTTYCNVCGGYEFPGEEIKSTRGGPPFPCPMYHGIVKKAPKGKSIKASASAEDKTGAKSKSSVPDTKTKSGGSEIDSEKDSVKRKKKRKKDDRFKFNYGYKGIPPQIGHSQCAMPCTGDMNPVPKHMGWLWTANNIPGLKVRPHWKPGAANKHVVRMYKIARFPEQVLSKRRKKDTGKKKRPLKRPLLIVQKKDGEYNVTMETMRTFTKPRTINQYPYEDKPLVSYVIGRTDEENAERKKRKERAERRLEREQRAYLQSAFHDMCKDICLKTYQQALGILPFQEDSFCPCYPENPPGDRIDQSHSCSCTDSTRSSGSMTDDDEWIIEFTPPNAYFNPAHNVKKIVTVDHSTQYTYLDYKVKLLDHYGNPVPRFFIGPDGKKECSDLGGFWGPGKKWLEINIDGFIAPDGRWAPNNFLGPCGEFVDAATGKFQATNGVWLTVGIDGYVDSNGKWCFYPKKKVSSKDPKKQRNVEAWVRAGRCLAEGEPGKPGARKIKHKIGTGKQNDDTVFSCFGDTSPRTLSQMGIAGHGHDRRMLLSTLETLMKQGEKVSYPQRYEIPKVPGRRKKGKGRRMDQGEMHGRIYPEKNKCKHHSPSTKGVMAMNDRGHKMLFQLKDYDNPRPRRRIQALSEEGISLSSFHVPCFSSFINSEMARQQQREHILKHNARVMEHGVQT